MTNPVYVEQTQITATTQVPTTASTHTIAHRSTARTVIAVILVLLGAASLTLTLISNWMRNDILNSDAFVEIYSPLIEEPQFQAVVSAAAATTAEDALANSELGSLYEGLTSGLSGLLENLPVDPSILGLIEGSPQSMQENIGQVVGQTTLSALQSSTVVPAWETTLRDVHVQLIGALDGTKPLMISGGQPSLTIETGPIIRSIVEAMEAEGSWYASLIPDVSTTVPLLQVKNLQGLQTWYNIVTTTGPYLPFASTIFLVAGMAMAPRRLLTAGIAGLFSAVGAALIIWGAPGLAGRYFVADSSADAQLLTDLFWHTGIAPLVHTGAIALGVSLAVAALSFAVAAIVKTVRSR